MMLPSLEKMILSEQWVDVGKHINFPKDSENEVSVHRPVTSSSVMHFFIIISPLLDFVRIIAVMNKVMCILCVNILE